MAVIFTVSAEFGPDRSPLRNGVIARPKSGFRFQGERSFSSVTGICVATSAGAGWVEKDPASAPLDCRQGARTMRAVTAGRRCRRAVE